MTDSFFAAVDDVRARRIPAAVCTVVKTEGSTPLKAGAKMLVRDDGTIAGTVGGGALEQRVIGQALEAIASGAATLATHRLVRDLNMCCGGTVEVFIDPLPIARRLYLFGAGHVNRALARHAAHLEFEITVIDARRGIFNDWDVPQSRTLALDPAAAVASLPWDGRTFAMIATHSHPLDRECLRACLGVKRAYLGMIGSARKVTVTRSLFIDQQWATTDELDRVDMPAGVSIKANSPHEIAVSILARIVDRANGGAPSGISHTNTASVDALDVAGCVALLKK